MMSTITKRIGVYCLALAMVVSTTGCETMGPLMGGGGDTANLTPAEKQMREDESRFNKTVFGGVVTGAAMGALAGGLMAAMMAAISASRSRLKNEPQAISKALPRVSSGNKAAANLLHF